MAMVLTDNKYYIAIANAIRDYSFGKIEGPLALDEFPRSIVKISNTGQQLGREEGYAQGYERGFEAGKENGAQSEYDRFWDEYQANGHKQNYRCAFNGYGWTEKNFYPKYGINGSNAGYQTFMFFNADGDLIDLSQRLKDCGVIYDSSKSTYFELAFYYAKVSVIPEVSTIGCKGQLNQVFSGTYAETIEKLILRDDGVQSFYNTFNNATALKNIIIEGKIGKNGFNVSWSPLTHDSLMSIITALQDKSGTGTTWSVTLGATNLAKLTDAEKAIATQRGWTLV